MNRTSLNGRIRWNICGGLVASVLLIGASAQAATWTIDVGASKLGFSGIQNGEKFGGGFKRFCGTVVFDPARPEQSHADVTIDITSATTGDTQRDEALPQPEWFNAKAFPQAHFTSSSFKVKGNDAYEAPGLLSIRGITENVVLPFTLKVVGPTAHAVAHLELVRTKFGVGQGPWSSADFVALEVSVDLDVVARKSGD